MIIDLIEENIFFGVYFGDSFKLFLRVPDYKDL